MKKQLLLAYAFVCACFIGRTQTLENYTPLESQGPIPLEFITPIESRYTTAVSEIDKKDKRRTRIDKRDFLLESHNELDMYLKSGHVVFNNDLYNYINKVAAIVLESEGVNAAKVKFFPIKYDYSNAFAFNEGVIFVNVGLIARCKNEAELAFVLGHEYAHYINHHSINYNVEWKKASRGQGDYKSANADDKMSLMSRYSKSNEVEADLYSYELLKKTKYNAGCAITSLQGLEYAQSIPEWTSFDKRVIERGLVRIPQIYLLENKTDSLSKKKKNSDSEEEDDEEEESFSHPSIDERINEIWDVFKVADTTNRQLYLTSQSEFEYIREVCRFEMCRIYLNRNNLDDAFCLTSSLLEKYPENAYLNRMMATVLYRLSFTAVNGGLNSAVLRYTKADEELEERNYFLHQLSKEELALLALRFSWDVRIKQPKQPEAIAISNQMVKLYTFNYKQNLDLFADSSTFTETKIDSLYIKEQPNHTDPSTGKKKKVAKKVKSKHFDFQHSFSYYALSDLKNDPDFRSAFEAAAKEGKKYEKKQKEIEDDDEDEEDVDEGEEEKKKKAKGKNKGIKKEDDTRIASMILLEPDFELIDERKKVSRNYVANEATEAKLRKSIVECSQQAGFDMVLLNANGIKEDDIQKMNDYAVLKEFLYETFEFSDNEKRALPTDYSRIQEISKRYNTRYMSVMINRNLIKKRNKKHMLYAALLSLPIPYIGIPWLISTFFAEKEFVYLVGVIDMQTGKLVYGSAIGFNRKETADLFKSQFYATLIELKGKGKKS